MKFHEIAGIFPMLTKDELQSLSEDIKQHGQLEPIYLFEGKILDGRNRFLACQQAKVEPRTKEFRGSSLDALVYVWSANIERRHLSVGQKAGAIVEREVLVARFKGDAAERLREGQLSGGRGHKKTILSQESIVSRNDRTTTALIGKTVGVSRSTIDRVQVLRRDNPVAYEAMKQGHIPLGQAYRETKLSRIHATSTKTTEDSFQVLVADPPWSYSNSGLEQSAAGQYPTMSTNKIGALWGSAGFPKAEKNAVLFLWATSPLLTDALQVMSSWGFTYKASMVWKKNKAPGIGFFLFTKHEFVLIGTRGDFPPAKRVESVFEAAVGKHSAKPDEAYALFEIMYPKATRIDIFARNARDNWDVWGNEAK